MRAPVRDLHVHSNCSDGLFDPADLARQSVESGVEEWSLTDHDTLVGLAEAETASQSLGISFMPGIELTCRFRDRAVHVLGYGFRPAVAASDGRLAEYMAEIKLSDHAWARQICRQSRAEPMVVTTPAGRELRLCVEEADLAWVRGTMPSSFHIAAVLSTKLAAISPELDIPARHCMYLFTGRLEPERRSESYWPEIRQRYAGLIDRYRLPVGAHWWIPRPTADLLDVSDAVAAIERIGGIPLLAHPGEQKLSGRHIREIAALGIRGLEVYTYKHRAEQILELEALAAELGLIVTAGTDFHDPYHRARVGLGRDQAGQPLRTGLSIGDFLTLGAYASVSS